jgi:N-acetyl-gamma-glutamyl-phosphate reductase
MIKAGIVGASGYTGSELLRLLLQHGQVEIRTVTSRAENGRHVADLLPFLRGRTDLKFSNPDFAVLRGCDVVFFATPNGTAMQEAPPLLEAGVRVIDLSADFRLQDVAVWRRWYGMEHACPAWLDRAVYGLPELNRDAIRTAALIANPGCYPTAVILGLLPLLSGRAVRTAGIVVDAKSGVSGAGRKSEITNLYSEIGESFKAYAVSGHRHQPEIAQALRQCAAADVEFTFVPHLVPMVRGIHATIYAELAGEVDAQSLFERRYAGEPFVDVLPAGSHPDTRSARGTNMCRVAVHRIADSARIVVLSVIDNLVKGAAGQAIQNMNLMFRLPEPSGLTALAVTP